VTELRGETDDPDVGPDDELGDDFADEHDEVDEVEADEVDEASGQPVGLRRALYALILIALLVLAGAVGWMIRGGGSSGSSAAPIPAESSVDVGFARDMSVHHTQAVTMAGYERDNTSNPAMKVLATDIETEQQFQIGEMQGWLDTWGYSRVSTNQMAWMDHPIGPTALMPGMATATQLNKLETLHGTALDIMFLQLMIHHHQGGVPMAAYAAAHATRPYVRDLAQSMENEQDAEIVQMEQLLRQMGSSPLPAPLD
jgi:uncharacterized protein (DUF305 family)